MAEERVTDFAQFLYDLGDLHDVAINGINFDMRAHEVTLEIRDLNACLRNGGGHFDPEPPAWPCQLVFRGVGSFFAELACSERSLEWEEVWISTARFEDEGNFIRFNADVSSGGPWQKSWADCLVIHFKELLIRDVASPDA